MSPSHLPHITHNLIGALIGDTEIQVTCLFDFLTNGEGACENCGIKSTWSQIKIKLFCRCVIFAFCVDALMTQT